MEFFEGLYKGFEAEYYVAGKLFSVGYEAFKLPGDFGFDLIVTNQKEQSMGPLRKGRLLEPPFSVQVKSRSRGGLGSGLEITHFIEQDRVSAIKKLAIPIAECGLRNTELKNRNSMGHGAWRVFSAVNRKAQGIRRKSKTKTAKRMA